MAVTPAATAACLKVICLFVVSTVMYSLMSSALPPVMLNPLISVSVPLLKVIVLSVPVIETPLWTLSIFWLLSSSYKSLVAKFSSKFSVTSLLSESLTVMVELSVHDAALSGILVNVKLVPSYDSQSIAWPSEVNVHDVPLYVAVKFKVFSPTVSVKFVVSPILGSLLW